MPDGNILPPEQQPPWVPPEWPTEPEIDPLADLTGLLDAQQAPEEEVPPQIPAPVGGMPWEAAGFSDPESWAAAGWPAPLDPETGQPWQGWQMYRMEQGRHPTGRKMTDEDWFNPYTQHILEFVRIRRLYDNPLLAWAEQMRARHPNYPMPGINVQELLREAVPQWYEEAPLEAVPEAPPTEAAPVPTAPPVTPPAEALAEPAPPEVPPEAPAEIPYTPMPEGWTFPQLPESVLGQMEFLQKLGILQAPYTPMPEGWTIPEWPELRQALEPPGMAEEMPPEPPTEAEERLEELPYAPVPTEIAPEVLPAEELAAPTPPTPRRPWDMLWESLQRRPPSPELITDFIWTALNWLSPGLEERIRIRLVDPTQEISRIVTDREALADEATTLLGEINAAESIWPIWGEPPTEMRLPALISQTIRGAYGTWFDLVFGILKKGDDAKNIMYSMMARWSEHHPIASMGAIGLSEEGFRPAMTPEEEEEQLGLIRQQLRGIISAPELSKEEIEEAVHEHEMVWSLLAMEPTFKNELRERVRTGEITWEEVMSNHRNDNLELFMNLGTSPWWFVPSGPFEVAFAPITKPLGLLARGVKATPVINSLFEFSKRSRVEKYADEAATTFDRMMRRIPGWREMVPDASFRAATKMGLEMFADDMMRAVRGEALETLELGADDAARLKAYIEFAEKGGFDLRNLIATAGSKEAVLSRLRWVARVEKAAELGVDLSRDRAFITETMQFMKEQWLGPNPAFVGTNFLDNSVKALMHDFYPAGDYATRFGEYGTTMPSYVHETLARRGMALEAETVTGRLGIPLISKPEWWLRGYAIETIEKAFGKRASQPIVKFLGKAVDYTKRPDLKGLGKAIAWGLDHANLESVILAGQRGWNIEYAFRAEGVLHKAGGIVETARPEFADDLYKAIIEAGFPEAEALAVRDGILSRFVKSPDDIGRVLQRLYPEGEIPVYGLADYPVQYSGKLGEVLGWLRTNLERIEKAGRVTPDAVSAQFDDALRVGQGVIDDVTKVAEGELPVSQVLGDIEDIIAIQGARRDVAVHRLGSLMNKVERAVIEGELPQSVLDDAIKARDKSIFRGRKLIQSSLKKSENARRTMIVEPLEELAKDLRAGKIDQAQFAIRYSQLVGSYKGYSRPLWDKANDDFVRMISAAIDRVQKISSIYEEPLSLEIAGKLARTEAIMKNIKATFREQVLGEWIDDATKLTDEVGRWKEWSLAKLVPEERVAEVVGAEIAVGDVITDGLVKGTVVGEGTFTKRKWPMWKIELPTGEVSLIGKRDAQLVQKAEAVAPEVAEALAPAEAQTRVAQLIEQFAGRWQTMVDDAIDEGIQYSKDIFFDYGQQMAFEEKARWWSPFIHWQILNPFYWLKHAGEMPWIPNAVRLYEWETDQHRQERGLTARFRWTVEAPLHDWMPRFFPEGYYGVDLRPFMSILTQLGIFTPYKEPFRYAEEDDVGKLLRAGEWIGLGTYPWWQAVEAKITTKQTPDMGDLFPITRAVKDLFGIDIGHITEIEDYYAKLELAARVAGNEIDEWTAKRAIMEGAGNPEYDSALEETQSIAKRLGIIRLFIPFTIKYATPGELAIREELKAYWEAPEERRPEPSGGVLAYWFLQRRQGETEEEYRARQSNAMAYEAYISRINEMNKWLSAQAQMYGVGIKAWEDITEQYWDDRDRVRSEYEEAVTPGMTETMRRVLAAPADRAVTSYRKLTRAFFDEEGNLKEGYEWSDLFSAQEKFKRELVRGSSARNPVSLLGFERAYYRWEIPEEAVLRSWERLYAQPVYEVINSTRELDSDERNRLIAEAKRIANEGRKNTAELEADIIRIHPDWEREKIEQALKAQLPTWDAWDRRNDPLRDALESVLWSGYWDLDDLARKQFREFIRAEPDIDPRIATIFEEIILPKEIEKAQVIWKRDMKLVSAKVLLILADRLGTLVDLQREGFQKEIEAAEREEELQPIEREEEPEARGRPPGEALPPMPTPTPTPTQEELYRREAQAQGLEPIEDYGGYYPGAPATPMTPESMQPGWPYLPQWFGRRPPTEEERRALERREAIARERQANHPPLQRFLTPEILERGAKERGEYQDLLLPVETKEFKKWAFEEAGLALKAQQELERVKLMVNRSVGGGGWNPSTWTIHLGSPALEPAIHEYAHAYWQPRREEQGDALVEAFMRLVEERSPQYEIVASLARDYFHGLTFQGMKLKKADWGKGSGPNKEWNDWEIFAGLASGSMGDLNRFPPYIRRFYEGLFTGEAKRKEGEPYADIWPAMAIRAQGRDRGGIPEDELARMWGDYQNPEYPIAGLVFAWAHNRFETPQQVQAAWDKIPEEDRRVALEWFFDELWPNVESHPERFGTELKDWQRVKGFLDFIGITDVREEPRAPGRRPPGMAMPLPTEEGVPPPPAPPEEEPPLPRYGERAFVPPGPAEEAEYDQAQAEMQTWVAGGKVSDWSPLMEKWFGTPGGTPQGRFWEYYWGEIPPGRIASDLRGDPIIEMLLNKAFRTVYDVKEGVWEQALGIMQEWRKAHPEIPGDPEEWARVREITGRYGDLLEAAESFGAQGRAAEAQILRQQARALWDSYRELLDKYYPPTERRAYAPAAGGWAPRRGRGRGRGEREREYGSWQEVVDTVGGDLAKLIGYYFTTPKEKRKAYARKHPELLKWLQGISSSMLGRVEDYYWGWFYSQRTRGYERYVAWRT